MYRVKNGRLGFPKEKIDKVKKILDDKSINYNIDGVSKTFNKNNYNKYYKLGIQTFNDEIERTNLLKSIKKLPYDKVLEISKYVNYIIYK